MEAAAFQRLALCMGGPKVLGTSGKDLLASFFADLLAAQLLFHKPFVQLIVAVHCRGTGRSVMEDGEREGAKTSPGPRRRKRLGGSLRKGRKRLTSNRAGVSQSPLLKPRAGKEKQRWAS